MNNRPLLHIVCALFFTGLLVGTAQAATGGPETINLKKEFKVMGKKKAVIFPHHQHQAKLPCQACHQSPAGGDALQVTISNTKGFNNDFHKKFCWPCHIDQKVPKGKSCTTCHK